MTHVPAPPGSEIETAVLSLTARLHDGDLPGFEAGVVRLCDRALSPVPALMRLSPWIEVMEGLHRARHGTARAA